MRRPPLLRLTAALSVVALAPSGAAVSGDRRGDRRSTVESQRASW